MHEVLRSHKHIPTQKFHQNFINFEKPQNFSKTPKPRFQNMKMHENERFKAYRVSERGLGRENTKLLKERSSEMKNWITQNLYIEVQ